MVVATVWAGGAGLGIARAVPPADRPELTGRVVAGYQGWFGAEGDGMGRGWTHYGMHGDFDHGKVTVDMWPDMTDYEPKLRHDTIFRHADGAAAQVFSSRDYGSVKLHFE